MTTPYVDRCIRSTHGDRIVPSSFPDPAHGDGLT